MLAHPASDPADISATCPNVSAAKRVCSCPRQLQCIVCKSGGGGDQRHSALASCLADLVTTHTGAKVIIEETIPGFPREPDAQPQGARARGPVIVRSRSVRHEQGAADMGMPFNTVLQTDASAALGVVKTWRGYNASRQPHKNCRCRTQIPNQEVDARTMNGDIEDVVTKNVEAEVLDKHMAAMRFSRRDAAQPGSSLQLEACQRCGTERSRQQQGALCNTSRSGRRNSSDDGDVTSST